MDRLCRAAAISAIRLDFFGTGMESGADGSTTRSRVFDLGPILRFLPNADNFDEDDFRLDVVSSETLSVESPVKSTSEVKFCNRFITSSYSP
jgi:hypothetical protein